MLELITAARTEKEADGSLGEQLAAINAKLDQLTQQVSYLHKRTRAFEELKDEMMPIARDALRVVSEELMAIEHEFNSEEVVYLLRKLLRNTPRFIRLLDRLESLDGLAIELEHLGHDVLHSAITELEAMEQKGYFQLLRGSLAVLDKVAAHYTQEDIDRLAGNIVLVLETVDKLSSPDVLGLVGGSVDVLRGEGDTPPEPVGPWGMLKVMGDPKVQRGLGVMVQLLKQVAELSNGQSLSSGEELKELPPHELGSQSEGSEYHA